MTQSATDRRLRKNAVPFQGKWYSNYDGALTGSQLVDNVADGDLGAVITAGGNGQIRIARPTKGDLIEARLTINAVALDGGLFRFYIGRFGTDGVTPLTLTDKQKAASWKKMTGFNDYIMYGIMDNVSIDGWNLMADIPPRDSSEFNEDAFIIGLELAETGGVNNFIVYDFKVDCTIQIAEVQI